MIAFNSSGMPNIEQPQVSVTDLVFLSCRPVTSVAKILGEDSGSDGGQELMRQYAEALLEGLVEVFGLELVHKPWQPTGK